MEKATTHFSQQLSFHRKPTKFRTRAPRARANHRKDVQCNWMEFSCAGCNASYIGETTRHICARVREHLLSDKSSHVYRHLQSSRACHDSCTAECFTILDSAVSKFQIKIKEAMHIKWENPTLNQQLKHLELSLSF